MGSSGEAIQQSPSQGTEWLPAQNELTGHLDNHPVHAASRTQQRSRKPTPKWTPDLPFEVQGPGVFSVPGVLFASEFICECSGCSFQSYRVLFNNGEAFQQSVSDHIKAHMGRSEEPSSSYCSWASCKSKLDNSSERNRIRHFTSHLAWYYLCPMCGRLSARPDLQPSGSSCLRGNCGRAVDEKVLSRIKTAEEKYGDPTKTFTMQGFYSIVLEK